MVAGSISGSINFTLLSDGNRRKVRFCQIESVLSQLEEIMKLAISIVTAISLGLSCTAPAHNTTHWQQTDIGGFTTLLWTYSRFLSKRPIRDIYGVVETPENSALIPNPGTAITPNRDGQPAAATRESGEEGSAVRR